MRPKSALAQNDRRDGKDVQWAAEVAVELSWKTTPTAATACSNCSNFSANLGNACLSIAAWSGSAVDGHTSRSSSERTPRRQSWPNTLRISSRLLPSIAIGFTGQSPALEPMQAELEESHRAPHVSRCCANLLCAAHPESNCFRLPSTLNAAAPVISPPASGVAPCSQASQHAEYLGIGSRHPSCAFPAPLTKALHCRSTPRCRYICCQCSPCHRSPSMIRVAYSTRNGTAFVRWLR